MDLLTQFIPPEADIISEIKTLGLASRIHATEKEFNTEPSLLLYCFLPADRSTYLIEYTRKSKLGELLHNNNNKQKK